MMNVLRDNPSLQDVHEMHHQLLVAAGVTLHEALGGRSDEKAEVDHPGQGEHAVGGIQSLPEPLPGNPLFHRLPENLEDLLYGGAHDRPEARRWIGQFRDVKSEQIRFLPVTADRSPDVQLEYLQRRKVPFRNVVDVPKPFKLLLEYLGVQALLPSEIVRDHGQVHAGRGSQFANAHTVQAMPREQRGGRGKDPRPGIHTSQESPPQSNVRLTLYTTDALRRQELFRDGRRGGGSCLQ